MFFRLLILSFLICGLGDGRAFSRGGGSFSSGGGHSFSSGGGGHSFSSGSGSKPSSGFSSGGKSFSSGNSSGKTAASNPNAPAPKFDSSAASAQKAQQGKSSFDAYKASKTPSSSNLTGGTPYSYHSSKAEYSTRTARQQVVFRNYYNRPMVVYHDSSWNPWFWMWLLDHRDHQATWVYNHRAEISEERYRDLLSQNKDLEQQLNVMKNRNVQPDSGYTPQGVDRDLMYSADAAKPTENYTWAAVLIAVGGMLILVLGFYWMCI